MNLKDTLMQFIKDGLAGAALVFILFTILAAIGALLLGRTYPVRLEWSEWSDFVAFLFLFPKGWISPAACASLIGFISMGIGGRYLEGATSRWGLLKPIFLIAMLSWIIGAVLFLLLFPIYWKIDWDWYEVGMSLLAVPAGFLVAGLAGVTFNPVRRFFRIMVGAIACAIVACATGFLMFLYQLVQILQ